MGDSPLQEFIINHEYWASIITFVVQIIFIYLRTVNVAAIADRKIWLAILSGIGIGISWIASTTLSVTSVIEFQFLPVVAHLIGGSLGTWWGMITPGVKKSSNKPAHGSGNKARVNRMFKH